MSTSPGQPKSRPYSDSGKNITIDYPVLNLIGNAPTKTIFNSIENLNYEKCLELELIQNSLEKEIQD